MPDAVKLLTDDEVAEIEARANAASSGPWEARFIYRLFQSARHDPANLFGSGPEQDWPDSEFMAHARVDVPALCRSLRLTKARLKLVSEDRDLLYDQLAQSRAENERLASQLKEWQEEKDAKAGYL